ncbi:hypothetical protein BGX38DRAFT_1142773 [Terfezia claveryi]|nr:hypothetical protein BGX38DRAFT_1142773 [Terfezia claveryi]
MDLVEHAIELVPNAKPFKCKIPFWTKGEKDYARKVFPEITAAGIVVMCDSLWGHRTRFIPKGHGSNQQMDHSECIPYTEDKANCGHSGEAAVHSVYGSECYIEILGYTIESRG